MFHFHDVRFCVEDPVKTFGDCLEKAGLNRFGTETMINGLTGEEMKCDIYIGLVYYQRLRHMVSDKFQCRSTGPVNSMTHQPVKGRKAGGGIRLGEMERDSLIAHGAAFNLHDRLHLSSDHQVFSPHLCRSYRLNAFFTSCWYKTVQFFEAKACI